MNSALQVVAKLSFNPKHDKEYENFHSQQKVFDTGSDCITCLILSSVFFSACMAGNTMHIELSQCGVKTHLNLSFLSPSPAALILERFLHHYNKSQLGTVLNLRRTI